MKNTVRPCRESMCGVASQHFSLYFFQYPQIEPRRGLRGPINETVWVYLLIFPYHLSSWYRGRRNTIPWGEIKHFGKCCKAQESPWKLWHLPCPLSLWLPPGSKKIYFQDYVHAYFETECAYLRKIEHKVRNNFPFNYYHY